jgi:hypothetical protein
LFTACCCMALLTGVGSGCVVLGAATRGWDTAFKGCRWGGGGHRVEGGGWPGSHASRSRLRGRCRAKLQAAAAWAPHTCLAAQAMVWVVWLMAARSASPAVRGRPWLPLLRMPASNGAPPPLNSAQSRPERRYWRRGTHQAKDLTHQAKDLTHQAKDLTHQAKDLTLAIRHSQQAAKHSHPAWPSCSLPAAHKPAASPTTEALPVPSWSGQVA